MSLNNKHLIGLALAPWDVLGAGRLRTDAEEERRRQTAVSEYFVCEQHVFGLTWNFSQMSGRIPFPYMAFSL